MLTYWENLRPPPNILIITLNWPPVPNACLQIFFSNIFPPTSFIMCGAIYVVNKGFTIKKSGNRNSFIPLFNLFQVAFFTTASLRPLRALIVTSQIRVKGVGGMGWQGDRHGGGYVLW